jgi:predicted dehydrogenase
MLNGMKPLSRSLRWGMVGGGATSQIGYSHRSAALRDNVFTLLAGAFDIDAERGRQFGEQLGIAPGAAMPIIKRCSAKRRCALTVLKWYR